VLSIIGVEGLAGGFGVTGGDDERPAIEPEAEPVRNAASGEHHTPFVGLVALARHADSSSTEILHPPAIIAVSDALAARLMSLVDTARASVSMFATVRNCQECAR